MQIDTGATVDLCGGSQQVAALLTDGGNGGRLINSNTGSVSILTLSPSGGSAAFSGTISGGGTLGVIGLVMSGSGLQILSGNNTYTGPTTINQGELMVNGSLVSPVTVNSGGILGGSGYLGSVLVNSGGTLAPGDAPAALTLTGSLGLAAGAVLVYELGTNDEISMPGELLALNGQQFSSFDFSETAGFGPGTYDLIAFGSYRGSLGNSTSGTVDGYPANLALSGNDLVLTVVPEPSTLALLGAGVIGLWAYGLRRRHPFPFVSIMGGKRLFAGGFSTFITLDSKPASPIGWAWPSIILEKNGGVHSYGRAFFGYSGMPGFWAISMHFPAGCPFPAGYCSGEGISH
jgi:autotransporter-associated beta strand protein